MSEMPAYMPVIYPADEAIVIADWQVALFQGDAE